MLYPQNIEEKIGFDQIRKLLAEKCLSPMGQAYVNKIRFGTDAELLNRWLSQADEFVAILQTEDSFPASNYLPIDVQLAKIRLEGAFLSTEELHDLKLSLQTASRCLDFLSGKEEEYPELHALAGGITLEKGILKELNKIVDERGGLRDDASRELQQIRRSLISEQTRVRKTLESILKQAISSGYSEEGVSLTIRGGRLVIPVLAEYKRRIKGFVQDESSTGQTVYLEPADVLDINNRIRELEYAERREIIRILREITTWLKPYAESMEKAVRFIGLVDFIRAKALLARELECVKPVFEKRPSLDWRNAIHPLLYLSHQTQQKPIVPLNIRLSFEQRILVISGPNAGGKSVALKTVALIQYMFQCGLLVPIAEDSRMGIFRSLFIDIGDEQSLENDLSTYSSHLTNMRQFLKLIDKRSLFLIDEFGTGTEPQFGGAIAEAILLELNRQRAWGVINTHYGNLKQLAENTNGLTNGAMRFDAARLEPLYQLEIGRPGSSFALEIARKIGLPQPVIEQAKGLVGVEQVELDKLLSQLEKEKRKFDKQNKQLRKQQEGLDKQVKEYEELSSFLQEQKKEIVREAKQQAKQLLAETNQKIENTIRAIKENKAEKEATKAARQQLDQLGQKLKVKPEDEAAPKNDVVVEKGPLSIGDLVRIKGQTALGEVIGLRGKDAEIRIGELKSKVKLNRLEKISKRAWKKEQQQAEGGRPAAMRGIDMNQRMADFATRIDVRGLRTDEALQQVDQLIDNATLFGSPELQIVHGKGDGILRQMIRQHLKAYPVVARMEDEHPDRGGAGITIVQLQH